MTAVLINSASARSELTFNPNETLQFSIGEDIGELREVAKIRTPVRSSLRNTKVLRRLQGFLIENGRIECKVGLIEKGELFIYYLPAENLHRGKIEAENQPFEMDEVEMSFADGRSVTYYEFRPLARPADSYSEQLDLSDETTTKRDFVLRELAKRKD